MKTFIRTRFGILISIIMLMQMLAPCAFAAGSNSLTIKSEQITVNDTSITVNVGSAISGGFMRVLELEADDEYSADNFFSYTSLATVGFADIKSGDNTVILDSAPTSGKKLIAVLRDTSDGTMVEYVSNAVTVTQAQDVPANAITIVTDEITPETTEITVKVQSAISAGLMKLIEMPVDEVYNSDNLNSYTQLAVAYAYTGGIVSGDNIMTLTAAPTAGKKVIAVLRDASEDVVDYVSEGVTVSGTGEPQKTYEEILRNCSVSIMKDGKVRTEPFKQEQTTVDYYVALDSSIESCRLQIYAYPGNTAFDPDSNATKRLGGIDVINGSADTIDVNLSEISVGYRIIAGLYIKLADDYYRTVTSNQSLEVVDENGQGFRDYVYPDAAIVETELFSDMDSLHISLTGDERIFEAAKEGKISINVAVAQYPADDDFDFENENQISLVSTFNISEPFTSKEIQLTQPLTAGYRVRAVVYWSQNIDMMLPKGNDYESVFNRPDDSVIVQQAEEKDFTISFENDIYENTTETAIHIDAKDGMESTILNIVGLCKVDDNGETDITNENSYVARVFGQYVGDISLTGISGLSAGDRVRFVIRYFNENNDTCTLESKTYTVLEADEHMEASVTITSQQVTVESTSVSVSAQFDDIALLVLYKYSGDAFSPETFTQEQRNDYAAIMFLASSPIDTTVNFVDGVSLSAGEKLAAVLWTNLYGDLIAKSEPVVIADAAPIEEPIAYIRNGEKLTAGQTQVTLTTIYDIRCTDIAYTLYQYEGEVLDKSTAEVIISGKPNNNTYDTYYIGTGKLTAGHKLQLSVIANGVEALSNIVTVLPSPDYGTPTIAINDEYITPDATEVTVTATYDDGHIEMDGYYSNITLYQCPIDSDTTSDEFWEQSWAKRVGSVQNSRGEVTIPVSGLEAGNKLVAKLRLPHAEWEGEEVDYISMPAYILEEGQTVPKKIVLLYNLGEDTSKGTKLAEIFNELDIEIKNITPDMLGEKVGYLAELDGYTESETKYEGGEPDTQFMLMCNLGEALLDKVLAAMQENNVTVNHKAILTMYNRDSQFYELIGDIESEHKEFQAILALDKIIKEGETLKEADYSAEKWSVFSAAFISAQNTLSAEAASYEDYLDAYCDLRKAIKGLSDITDYTDIQKNMNLVVGSTATANAAIIVGYYKNGVLLELDTDTVNGDFTHALLDVEGADEIKVFLWNSINSMIPLYAVQAE